MSKAHQTFLEQVNQQPIVMLELDEVATIRLQMSDCAASTILFLKFQDAEVRREYRLWKVGEVPELVRLAVLTLYLTKYSLQITRDRCS